MQIFLPHATIQVMKKTKKTAMKFLLLLALSAPDARAFEIGGLIGPSFNSPSVSVSGSTSIQGGFSIGSTGGVFIGMGILPMIGVELGTFLSRRSLATELGAITATQYFTSVHVPLLLRINLPIFFSISAGPYLNHSFGSVTQKVGAAEASGFYSDAGLRTLDGGLLASIRWSKSIVPLISFLVDARYKLGLSNLSSAAGSTVKTRETEILVGAGFSL